MATVYLFNKKRQEKKRRIARLFAWLPVKMTNTGRWVWLCTYLEHQVYDPNGVVRYWRPERTSRNIIT